MGAAYHMVLNQPLIDPRHSPRPLSGHATACRTVEASAFSPIEGFCFPGCVCVSRLDYTHTHKMGLQHHWMGSTFSAHSAFSIDRLSVEVFFSPPSSKM